MGLNKDISILIVEDDSALLRGLVDNFVSYGYNVDTAEDGETGLAKALSIGPDLIILDLMLPGINGYEVCEAVRREGYETPVIMLTAVGQEEDIVRGLETGADDYVTKPFSIGVLMARVRALLRRQAPAGERRLRFGEYELDLESHRLFGEGGELELTTKEYRLLKFFLQRQGRALTREMILNVVWGSSLIVTVRSVDRCVTTLRSKIEADPRHPKFIHTIRDVGYRFEVG